jgi:hypothetical protein
LYGADDDAEGKGDDVEGAGDEADDAAAEVDDDAALSSSLSAAAAAAAAAFVSGLLTMSPVFVLRKIMSRAPANSSGTVHVTFFVTRST